MNIKTEIRIDDKRAEKIIDELIKEKLEAACDKKLDYMLEDKITSTLDSYTTRSEIERHVRAKFSYAIQNEIGKLFVSWWNTTNSELTREEEQLIKAGFSLAMVVNSRMGEEEMVEALMDSAGKEIAKAIRYDSGKIKRIADAIMETQKGENDA